MDKIHHITEESELYPSLLREIHEPPADLYIRGNIEVLQYPQLLAVVGSRKASVYGKQCVSQLLPPVIKAGIGIVSGLAYGIDSLAHRTTLENKGLTIAVLGSGIDNATIYPRSHISLAKSIIEAGGAIVSEYAPGTPASQFHFPARNRIIAGLCQATLIIQAAERSGSLITGRLALESNRDVCAVPGAITDPLAAGTNQLIRQGAAPIVAANDLLDLYGISTHSNANTEPSSLSESEQLIYSVLTSDGVSLDQIIEQSKMPSAQVLTLITQLELSDLIQHAGTLYYRKESLS